MPGDVSLRDLMEARVSAIEKELRLSRESLDKRLESMNEFREQMSDQQKSYLPRAEYYARHETLEKRIAGLEKIVWGMGGGIALIEVISHLVQMK